MERGETDKASLVEDLEKQLEAMKTQNAENVNVSGRCFVLFLCCTWLSCLYHIIYISICSIYTCTYTIFFLAESHNSYLVNDTFIHHPPLQAHYELEDLRRQVQDRTARLQISEDAEERLNKHNTELRTAAHLAESELAESRAKDGWGFLCA